MSSKKCHLTYALGALVMGAALVLVGPVGAEDATTIDLSRQPHLKSWSNVIPNATRRFIMLADFNNEAVLDRETGLVWEKSPETTPMSWFNARFNCVNKNVGGRKGWRLPSIPELMSLVDPTQNTPSLPDGHPFLNIQSSNYWSATAHAVDPNVAWNVLFHNGIAHDGLGKGLPCNVWCVRGGMNTDTY